MAGADLLRTEGLSERRGVSRQAFPAGSSGRHLARRHNTTWPGSMKNKAKSTRQSRCTKRTKTTHNGMAIACEPPGCARLPRPAPNRQTRANLRPTSRPLILRPPPSQSLRPKPPRPARPRRPFANHGSSSSVVWTCWRLPLSLGAYHFKIPVSYRYSSVCRVATRTKGRHCSYPTRREQPPGGSTDLCSSWRPTIPVPGGRIQGPGGGRSCPRAASTAKKR